MQFKAGPPPPGVIFDSALSRSEHVLAMAAIYSLQLTRTARLATVSVSRPDLRTAAFADALSRALSGQGPRNSTPIGILGRPSQGAAHPMADAVLNAKGDDGAPRYPHEIHKMNDTADVAALIRNGISAQQPNNGVVFVAGPLSNLVAAMALPDVKPYIEKRVRALVIAADADDFKADLPAARKVLAEWPSPIVLLDMPQLAFPGAQLDTAFAWSLQHAVVLAYRAFKAMPYDAPLGPAAGILYAVRPDSELFSLSSSGKIEVADNGSARLVESGSGAHKVLRLADGQRDAAVRELVALISAEPPQGRGGRGGRGGKQNE